MYHYFSFFKTEADMKEFRQEYAKHCVSYKSVFVTVLILFGPYDI